MFKKRFYKLFFPVLLCSVVFVSMVRSDIVFPSKENVRIYKIKISRDRGVGKMMTYCIVGSAIASLAYMSYKFFFKDTINVSTSGLILTNEQLTERLTVLEKKYSKKVDPEFLSYEWLINVGKDTFNGSLSTGLGYIAWDIVKKTYDTYNCFNNLEVFVEKRLNDMRLLDDLTNMANSLDYSYENSGSNLAKTKSRFIVAFKTIVSEVEAIVAFMEYKIEGYLSKGILVSKEELLLPNNLFEYTNDFCRKIILEFENYCGNDAFFVVTNDYVSYIRSMIKIFSCLESRVCWEKG